MSPAKGLILLEKGERLYYFLEFSASKTTCANLDCLWSTINHCLNSNKVWAELSLLCYTNMLTNTAVLLSLTFTRNNLSSNSTLTANITSSCHDYIHLNLCYFFYSGGFSISSVRAYTVKVRGRNYLTLSNIHRFCKYSFYSFFHS